jgi:methylated-DNA-[protein]-cysteine S-methyltransferase
LNNAVTSTCTDSYWLAAPIELNGGILLEGTADAVHRLQFKHCPTTPCVHLDTPKVPPFWQRIRQSLQDYLAGQPVDWSDTAVRLDGTNFRQQVWQALREIPWGETRSYQEVAEHIHNPKAAQAVGQANRRNPVPLIVPCHRVIGKNGRSCGYSFGPEVQRYLLALEKIYL